MGNSLPVCGVLNYIAFANSSDLMAPRVVVFFAPKKRMLRSYCVTILSRSYHDTIAILFRSISLRPDYDRIAIVGRSYYDLITS